MSRPPGPKIKKYEMAYRIWLRKLFRLFGKFTREQAAKALAEDKDLPPDLVDYFYSKINFEPVNKAFVGVLSENEKYFQTLIKDLVKESQKKELKTIPKEVKRLITEAFPQKVMATAMGPDIEKKGINFFELETTKIKDLLQKDFETRKNQLDDFRQSFLFNSPKKIETFLEKYPEPKYAFTESMGRTEINNLNRDLSATMATNLGAKKFVWLTSQDERVRESHRKLNKKEFSYDNMPKEYNDYNCRCTQEPVFDYLEDLYGF